MKSKNSKSRRAAAEPAINDFTDKLRVGVEFVRVAAPVIEASQRGIAPMTSKRICLAINWRWLPDELRGALVVLETWREEAGYGRVKSCLAPSGGGSGANQERVAHRHSRWKLVERNMHAVDERGFYITLQLLQPSDNESFDCAAKRLTGLKRDAARQEAKRAVKTIANAFFEFALK